MLVLYDSSTGVVIRDLTIEVLSVGFTVLDSGVGF